MGAAILPASRRRRAVRSLEALVIFGLVASALAPGLRPGVLAAAAVLCALRPLFVRAERRPWLVLAIALTFRLAGIHPAFYPAAAIALALLARDGAAKAQDRDVGPWLDIAAAALGATALGAALGAAAPGLVLIGASAALMALRSWRPGPAWSLLGGGLIVFAVVDPVAGAALVALAAWRPITKEQTARPDGVLGPIVTGIMAAAAIA